MGHMSKFKARRFLDRMLTALRGRNEPQVSTVGRIQSGHSAVTHTFRCEPACNVAHGYRIFWFWLWIRQLVLAGCLEFPAPRYCARVRGFTWSLPARNKPADGPDGRRRGRRACDTFRGAQIEVDAQEVLGVSARRLRGAADGTLLRLLCAYVVCYRLGRLTGRAIVIVLSCLYVILLPTPLL